MFVTFSNNIRFDVSAILSALFSIEGLNIYMNHRINVCHI
jgi:hypothetical protein